MAVNAEVSSEPTPAQGRGFEMTAKALLHHAHTVLCFSSNARQTGLDDLVFKTLCALGVGGPLSSAEVALGCLLNFVQPVVEVVRGSTHACAQASHCLQTLRIYARAIAIYGLLHFIAQVQNIFPFGVRHEYAFKG